MDGATDSGASFGAVGDRIAHLYTLENNHLRAHVTDYGGILVSLEVASGGGPRRALRLPRLA